MEVTPTSCAEGRIPCGVERARQPSCIIMRHHAVQQNAPRRTLQCATLTC